MPAYKGPERRQGLPFNEDEKRIINAMIKQAIHQAVNDFPFEQMIEQSADRAAEKLTNDLYRAVGKSVLQKITVAIGVLVVGVMMWLEIKGVIKK